MPNYLHDRDDFKTLLEITAKNKKIDDTSLVEKDYWIMNCLYGIQKAVLHFELKGGTSLSKGYEVIDRFSEDIDLRIDADKNLTGFEVYSGKNHVKDKHVESRKKYFDWLTNYLKKKIPGITDVKRDTTFDDPTDQFRNGGIRLYYEAQFPSLKGVKEGILLEVGFDKTAPNVPLFC